MVTIYHASDKIVSKIKNPEKEKIGYRKDFGYGFYCTRIKKQAERWNELKYDNRGVVNTFLYDEERALKNVKIKYFKEDDEWLEFVVLNRSKDIKPEFDIIEGPMADDKIFNYIQSYMDEEISKDDFWEKVRFNKLTNQICFLTEKAVKFLEFKGVEKNEKR